MLTVTRIQNPLAVKAPAFKDFLDRALAKSLFCPAPIEDLEPYFSELIRDPKAGIFVANDGLNFVGLLVVMLPANPLYELPQCCHIWADGPKGTKSGLLKALVDFVRQNGYTQFRAVNDTGVPDSIWKRAFRAAGDATRVGSIMTFNLEK